MGAADHGAIERKRGRTRHKPLVNRNWAVSGVFMFAPWSASRWRGSDRPWVLAVTVGGDVSGVLFAGRVRYATLGLWGTVAE